MDLREQLDSDLIQAMKSRDAGRLSVLRMIRAEILNLEKAGKGEVDEPAILQALQRMARQRGESIEQFAKGDREDLVKIEEAELEVIQSYLPEETSAEEIAAAVAGAIESSGASSLRDMGKAMGLAMKQLKETGKTVDGGKVGAAVKQALSDGE